LQNLNDEYSNFGTTCYDEDKIIFASPRNSSKIIKNVWEPNEQPFLDLYIVTIDKNGEIRDVNKLNLDVNSRYHDADVVYTNDLKTVYFTRDNYYNNKLKKDDDGKVHLALFRADVVEYGKWENVVEMPFNNKDYSIGHPALSPDNKTLYFVTDVPGTFGKTDIYKVAINSDGTYGTPENLGDKINTTYREMFPYISENDIMYFSSDRGGGYGNLDIYFVRLDDDSKPIKLPLPINSFEDDFAFLKKKGDDFGYFSSNRPGGKGDDDIYYFIELEPSLDCRQTVTGVVVDKNNGELIPGDIVVLFDKEGNEKGTKIVKEDAKFEFKVKCDSKYIVKAFKENYSFAIKEIKTTDSAKLELELPLEKLSKKETKIVYKTPPISECQIALEKVDNIYFDLDKAVITPLAAIELDKVIYVMKKCPNIHVIASSHTDSRASFEYNLDLSQRRAESTVNYIVNKGGIARHRLTAVGYGETRLLNRCKDDVECSEEDHSVNRRTQFDVK
jgi:outer membrane protein OmpA-like peptidoglycan-associated protein